MRKAFGFLLLALVVTVGGCKKKEEPAPAPEAAPPAVEMATPAVEATPTPGPPAVAGVTLGSAIGADKKVTTPSETFTDKDTIYASVDTTGQGHAKLRALWSYLKGGKTAKVDETALEFDATGPASNAFHIQNSKPWPKGDYQVEIFLGDDKAPAMTKTFKVS